MKARIRIAALGVLAMSAFTLVAGATGGIAGAATPNGYSASVTSQGLNLVLFGNKLTGGNATACVNQGTETANSGSSCDTKATPYSAAAGSGTFLTSSGLSATSSSSAGGDSQSDLGNNNNGKDTTPNETCSPATTGGPQGGGGVTLNLGVGCGFSGASNDASGNPSAWSGGNVVNIGASLAGVLAPIVSVGSAKSTCTTSSNQLIGALLGGVCTLLGAVQGGTGAAPAPVGTLIPGVEQALQNIYDVVNNAVTGLDTVDVQVGDAQASICPGVVSQSLGSCIDSTDGSVQATSQGSTLKVSALQGVGCAPSADLVTCATNEVANLANENNNPTAYPLIEVQVGPAGCTATRDPSSGQWTAVSLPSLVSVDVYLPGDPIQINIPGNAGTSQTILSGTPLQSTITVSTGASSPVGDAASCTANALTLNLLQSTTFPGATSTVGAIYASLGNTALTAANTNVPAPAISTSPSVVTPTPAAAAAAPVVPAAVVPNVTTVHTGEFWSGSLPTFLLAGMGATGLALIGRRRLAGGFRSLFMRGARARR